MTEPKNNQEFYDQVDATCLQLRQVGMDAEANLIHHLLHKVPWNSTSELFNELESTFENLLSSENAAKLPQQIKDELSGYLRILGNM